MSEFASASAKTEARVGKGLEVAGLVLATCLTAASATETVTHADELCLAGKGGAAMIYFEATGTVPGWTPPDYNPLTSTSGAEAMNYLLSGSLTAGATQPSTCF